MLIKNGWDIGYNKLFYQNKEVKINIIPSGDISCVDFNIMFSINGGLYEEVLYKVHYVIDILTAFYSEVDDLKITLDANYYVSKDVIIKLNDLQDIVKNMNYIEKKTSKNKFRKFEIINNHNVTSKINFLTQNENVDLNICISVENMVINRQNLYLEIINSLYYYVLEYVKLHYNIVKELNNEYLNQNSMFYSDIKQKFKF